MLTHDHNSAPLDEPLQVLKASANVADASGNDVGLKRLGARDNLLRLTIRRLAAEKDSAVRKLKQLKEDRKETRHSLDALSVEYDQLQKHYQKLTSDHQQLQRKQEDHLRTLSWLRESNLNLKELSAAWQERHNEAITSLQASLEAERLRSKEQYSTLIGQLNRIRSLDSEIRHAALNHPSVAKLPEDDSYVQVAVTARECLSCGICLEIMQTPHVVACGHSFHEVCINRCRNASICPICRCNLIPGASRPLYGFGDLANAISALGTLEDD